MPTLNLAFLCITFIYFGYGSFAYIPIVQRQILT
jgi:hypothetical protein